ncbi:tRNA pseudouridine(38-40) synthase TruA [Nitrosomonas sp. Nm166]|uniref:tRNA pseudouridine(38-40) synthase TruA n=1 Tax=Nitrosomonas sp. Nm166 TaxID=1881054 RepID=UPI0008E48086|nr:tRNA pseudouridine(38-40) synthase TruA [Nitrosomonas sp. Nm166]SFF06092.1 tRNA pseudouridine38-40 synthase [Nitrosomonas sp. Nm166]
MRIVLILEYDGSRYCGWQSQPEGCSIQDTLETALSEIAKEEIHVITAGRTDTGVHALYQVVHFDTSVQRPISAWVRGVNALLPNDIAILWAAETSDEFHARYNALERHYLYLLLNQPTRPGIHHSKVGWYHQPLELEKMQVAGSFLIGEHDFSSFRAAECQAKSPIRTITRLSITRHGNLLIFELRANAFLHHMVRNIIGCLVYIGKGKYSPEWMCELLKSCNRTYAAPTFSSAGLYLTGIRYDRRWYMPELAEAPIIPGISLSN